MRRLIFPFLLIVGLMFGQASVAVAQDDDQPVITIGSKPFTEQLVLAEMYALILEDAGYEVERQLNLGGTAVVHQALVNDEIDMYVEYTGTALLAILGQELPDTGAATPAEGDGASATPAASVADVAYNIVAEAYPEQFDAVWLDSLGLNNTYTITVRQETADEFSLETISDLEGVAEDLVLGTDQEFPVRPDGLPGLENTYGIGFEDVVILDAGLMYSAVDQGEVDAITAYATDGRIPALGLVILEDDREFFPPYYAAPVVDQELLEQNPELEETLNQLAGMIDNETMAEMNAQVDEEGREPVDVARDFLMEQGIIGGGE